MITLDNFNWSITNRKLVIFIPNWGRGEYIRKTVKTIQTKVPRDKWLVIVINDRIHEDLSDLKDDNVLYLTFGPDRVGLGRGDGFARNIAIKRCQSEWFFQKDPEIIVTGDFINSILNCPTDMYRLSGPAQKTRKNTSQKFLQGDATIEDCSEDAENHPINPNQFVYFHFGFAVKTDILRNMRGYDEDYKKMYCADRDLYMRLMAQGVTPTFDPGCHPIHLWHEVPWFPNSPQTRVDYEEMKNLFANKDPKQFIRNDPETWGEGD
jgi:GT2 family glycosyltransferase